MRYIIYIMLFVSVCSCAQTYPETENIMDAHWQAYQIPHNKPEYLKPFINNFNLQVTRVSDIEVFGEDSQRLRHHYSKDSPWNSDGTLIKLAGFPAAILDGETYKFIKWANIPSSATWSNTNPELMYGTTGNSLILFNVTLNTRQELYVFDQFDKISYGFNEGNLSNNDRYIGIIGENGNDLTLLVFDILNHNIVGTDTIGNVSLAWFSVSPLGNYAVSSFAEDGSEANQGLKVYNINMTNKRHISDFTTHADLGVDVNGNEVYVAFGDKKTRPNNFYMKMVRLSDGLETPLFKYTEANGVWGGHISCRNINRPGWAYVSEGCCETIGKKEIFAIKLDDSNTIQRFGYHHATYSDIYQQEAHAVPNRDGTKIMFASSWNGMFTTKYPSAFIIENK